MKNIKATLLTVILMCLPLAALADFRSGNGLLEDCQTPEGMPSRLVCSSYILTIVDVLRYDDVVGIRSCVPTQATTQQVTDVVTQYLQQHPELRHYGAVALVARALSESFPCN